MAAAYNPCCPPASVSSPALVALIFRGTQPLGPRLYAWTPEGVQVYRLDTPS